MARLQILVVSVIFTPLTLHVRAIWQGIDDRVKKGSNSTEVTGDIKHQTSSELPSF